MFETAGQQTSLAVAAILARLGQPPVLVDVGAAGRPPRDWLPIARQAVFVGFDPDQRQLRDDTQGLFARTIILNQAVTADPQADAVTFRFTRDAFCSSTLEPNMPVLGEYVFADRFQTIGQGAVPATTLEAALRQLKLSGVDWLKVDTQGTDLRIFNSLPDHLRNKVLAVDVEPGLMEAYVGEDMFPQLHTALTDQGFWLGDLDVRGSVRIRQATLKQVAQRYPDLTPAAVETHVRTSPGWCQALYLRSVDALIHAGAGRREFALAWVIGLLHEQAGYALDLALAYEREFGPDESSRLMFQAPVALIRRAQHHARLVQQRHYPIALLGRVAGKIRSICAPAA